MLYTPEKITRTSFVERVIERMKALSLSITQVALQTNIKESTLKNILYKTTEVSRPTIIALASVLQTTVEFLVTGSYAENDSDSLSLSVQTPEGLARALGIVTGGIAHATLDPPFNTIPLPKKVLERYNIAPESIRAVSINTQSLAPSLTQNDVALVDISATNLSEGVFIICIRDSVIIRHVSPVTKGFAFSSTSALVYGTTINVDSETGELSDPDVKIVGRIFSKLGIRDL